MDPQQQLQLPPSPPAAAPNRPHSAPPGREDCWSEGASKILVDAWGERYLQLNRGNLRQKDWKEVAQAVNSRNDGVKPPRTDVQCKNRIDTLKKKYKLEKSRPSASKWLFYNRLDYLIGNSSSAAGSASTAPNKKATAAAVSTSIPDRKPSTSVTLTINPRAKLNSSRSPNQYSGGTSSKSNGSSLGGDDDTEFVRVSRKQKTSSLELSEETPYKELAKAILRFGEIYERIESSKQEQLMDLEKQRMEFTKDLEFQRMNMFTEAHLQLEKSKKKKKKKKKKPINNHTPDSGEFPTLNVSSVLNIMNLKLEMSFHE